MLVEFDLPPLCEGCKRLEPRRIGLCANGEPVSNVFICINLDDCRAAWERLTKTAGSPDSLASFMEEV